MEIVYSKEYAQIWLLQDRVRDHCPPRDEQAAIVADPNDVGATDRDKIAGVGIAALPVDQQRAFNEEIARLLGFVDKNAADHPHRSRRRRFGPGMAATQPFDPDFDDGHSVLQPERTVDEFVRITLLRLPQRHLVDDVFVDHLNPLVETTLVE